MKKIAQFYKVSFEEFKKAFEDMEDDKVQAMYDEIKLPKRATQGSAGYDFFVPYDLVLKPNETAKIRSSFFFFAILSILSLLFLLVVIFSFMFFFAVFSSSFCFSSSVHPSSCFS